MSALAPLQGCNKAGVQGCLPHPVEGELGGCAGVFVDIVGPVLAVASNQGGCSQAKDANEAYEHEGLEHLRQRRQVRCCPAYKLWDRSEQLEHFDVCGVLVRG